MNAVDTNVVVRLIVSDDPRQLRLAQSLLLQSPVWVSKTVFLETIWVLGKFYRYEAAEIHEMLETLVGLDNVRVEDEESVTTALDFMEHGVDPADAMHLASTPAGVRFVTFDRDLVRNAKRAGASNVVTL
jgi:predicted nucleic-acid-binding protein